MWPFTVAAAIAVVTVAGLAVVWRSSHRADLEGFAGLAISVTGIAAGWIAWVWRHKDSQNSGVVSGQELGQLADLLAGAVDGEWTRAAGKRGLLEPEPIPVRWQRPSRAVNRACGGRGDLDTFCAVARAGQSRGAAAAGGPGKRAAKVYGGLGSGRLVIAGGPRSGKSSAAVLLILAALRHRQSVAGKVRPEVPVPVMFTLHGWDPGTQRAQDWLAERLRQTYPLFAASRV